MHCFEFAKPVLELIGFSAGGKAMCIFCNFFFHFLLNKFFKQFSRDKRFAEDSLGSLSSIIKK